MRIVALSDTHGQHRGLDHIPDGDVLVFAGDLSIHGNLSELRDFAEWFSSFPHDYKIVVAGNHDFMFAGNKKEEAVDILKDRRIIYLEDETIQLDGTTFYGTPYSQTFDRYVFNEGFGKIPPKTDVLISHGPPQGRNDYWNEDEGHVGSKSLREAVDRIEPQLHLYGHIHERHGNEPTEYGDSINVSICDRDYEVSEVPVVVEL